MLVQLVKYEQLGRRRCRLMLAVGTPSRAGSQVIGKRAIADRERAVVVAQSGQQLLRPAGDGLCELRGDFRAGLWRCRAPGQGRAVMS